MSAVFVSSASTDLARRVRIATEDRLTVIQPEQLPSGPAQMIALATSPESVSGVVLDVRGGNGLVEHALDLASRFEEQLPDVGVLIVSDVPDQLALRALRSGVRDVLDPDADISDFRWALRRAMEVPSRGGSSESVSADGPSGRVVTVASPKGGVGKTTVATNLARALVDQAPTGTVLVDLDVQFGDVAAALDLDPNYTIGDILEGPALSDPIALKTLLSRHSSGLHVVAGVRTPVEAEALTPQRITQLLSVLRREFRYVVLDTAPGLTEHTLVALDHTTDLVLVTSLDVPGVRGLRKELEVLDQLGLHPHTRHVVLNNVDRIAGLTVSDVEAAIGRKVDFTIPRSAAVLRSTNTGSPLVEASPRDRISRDLRVLAGRFAPAVSHGERSRWRRSQS